MGTSGAHSPQVCITVPQEIRALQKDSTTNQHHQPTRVGFLEKPGHIFDTGLVVTGHLSWDTVLMETLFGP